MEVEYAIFGRPTRKGGDRLFCRGQVIWADIILSFPIYENVFDNEVQIKDITGEKGDLYKKYPHLAAWCDKIRNNPRYIKITEMMDGKVDNYIRSSSTSKK